MYADRNSGLQVRLQQILPIPLDAQLHCDMGELLVLVGPSGSGKSTILRCIAGLADAATGLVRFEDFVWLDTESGVRLSPQKRSVGLVFQHYALFPHLSALENITVVLDGLARNRRRADARELLELVNLNGLENRRPDELSGGQQQRLALARSLARDPDVLLLDEPFSAVDQITRRKLQRELARMRHHLELPIILVTHDLDEACVLADRMCILHRGETLQSGAPYEVMSRPQTETVARLVGLSNLFKGKVLGHDSVRQITLLDWAGYTLQCGHHPEVQPGQTVNWVVPPENVILHRRHRPSRGERENPVNGVISDFVVLGGDASITMLVNGDPHKPLSFSLSTHVAHRNGLGTGEHIRISLLAKGIHMML